MRKPLILRAFSVAVTLTPLRSLPPSRCLFSTSASAATAAGGIVAVKKVTKSNFTSALEELRAQVRASDFVAVDLEMTGVTSAPWREAFEFDRSDVRYSKVKDSAEKFAVVQFGVCPFRWDDTKESFVAHPHNFYIFPRGELSIDGPCNEFHCQTTSINFLAKYQFDFNACIYEGISYLSRAQEAKALNGMSAETEGRLSNSMKSGTEPSEMPLVRTADVLFTERMKIRFHEWHNSIVNSQGVHCTEGGSNSFKSQFQTSFFKMRPAITLSGFSSRQHKLIQMVIRKNFDDLVYVCATGDNLEDQKKVVYAASKDDKALLMVRHGLKVAERSFSVVITRKLACAVGFRQVIDLLSSEDKLLQIYWPLPSSITEFASALHKTFAHIIDTRHLLKANPVIRQLIKKNSTSLSSAFSLLCPHISLASHNIRSASYSDVKVEVKADATGSNSGAKHEAGYDAFMTGCIFAQSCSHLGIDFKLPSASTKLAENPNLQNHINLLYPSWNGGVVTNLQTGEEIMESSAQLFKWRYPKMIFDNTIILWGFSATIKPRELKECLCTAFGQDSITSIFYLDATAALRNDDAIRVLHPLSRLLDGGRTSAGSYEIYKKFCCSPISKPLIAEQAEAMGIRWETSAPQGFPGCSKGSDSRVQDLTSASVAKNSEGDVGPVRKDPHRISCEDILDSLYASHALVGR
ncbi:unnamed protein product [Spirodela intermedia]|uniref:Uncharacterized protein n=1 Tax=Spirodela intermedia TaxID=51605 RepID=A0A7I8JRR5_SPIIN|nr:unnamed protein product [Spirodela intermedia]CAA6672445.1 unnamed protein product [Spirodela intermedia]